MKNIITVIAIVAIFVGFGNTTFSQNHQSSKSVVSDTLHVHGVCNMCKERIENAALIKGVKKATWDKYTHKLVLFYKPSKVTLDDIEKEVAKAGHDTQNYKADEETYESLPNCCAYRSGEIHTH